MKPFHNLCITSKDARESSDPEWKLCGPPQHNSIQPSVWPVGLFFHRENFGLGNNYFSFCFLSTGLAKWIKLLHASFSCLLRAYYLTNTRCQSMLNGLIRAQLLLKRVFLVNLLSLQLRLRYNTSWIVIMIQRFLRLEEAGSWSRYHSTEPSATEQPVSGLSLVLQGIPGIPGLRWSSPVWYPKKMIDVLAYTIGLS